MNVKGERRIADDGTNNGRTVLIGEKVSWAGSIPVVMCSVQDARLSHGESHSLNVLMKATIFQIFDQCGTACITNDEL